MAENIVDVTGIVAMDQEVDEVAEMKEQLKGMIKDSCGKFRQMKYNIYQSILTNAAKYKTVSGTDHVLDLMKQRSDEWTFADMLETANNIAKDTAKNLFKVSAKVKDMTDLQYDFTKMFFDKEYNVDSRHLTSLLFKDHIQAIVNIEIMQNIGSMIDSAVEFEQKTEEEIDSVRKKIIEKSDENPGSYILSLYEDEVGKDHANDELIEELIREYAN